MYREITHAIDTRHQHRPHIKATGERGIILMFSIFILSSKSSRHSALKPGCHVTTPGQPRSTVTNTAIQWKLSPGLLDLQHDVMSRGALLVPTDPVHIVLHHWESQHLTQMVDYCRLTLSGKMTQTSVFKLSLVLYNNIIITAHYIQQIFREIMVSLITVVHVTNTQF